MTISGHSNPWQRHQRLFRRQPQQRVIAFQRLGMAVQAEQQIAVQHPAIADVDDDFAWAEFDENTACGLCYTSGTTGNPKGVLYSHRSNVIHAFIAGQTDAMGVGNADTILPVEPDRAVGTMDLMLIGPRSLGK